MTPAEIVVYVIITGLVCTFSYKMVKVYSSLETKKHDAEQENQFRKKYEELKDQFQELKNAHAVNLSKMRTLRAHDLDLDDYEYDENDEQDTQISDLVSAIFPQLPKKLTKLADREDILKMVSDIAAKNPGKVSTFIENFAKKKDAGSPTNTPASYGV